MHVLYLFILGAIAPNAECKALHVTITCYVNYAKHRITNLFHIYSSFIHHEWYRRYRLAIVQT